MDSKRESYKSVGGIQRRSSGEECRTEREIIGMKNAVYVWCGRVDSNHHGIATASPSSWCVCQFRHDRAVLILSAEDFVCQT